MKFLREIAGIVTRFNANSPAKIFSADGRKTKTRSFRMFAALLQGRYKTDKEAANDIYEVEPSHPKYRKLKSRVKEQLLQALFSLDIRRPRYSSELEAFYHCNKNTTFAKILITLGASNSGVTLAHKTLLKAQEAHLFDLVLQCGRLLRSHYSFVGFEKQFNEYDRLVGAMIKIQQAEIESDRLREHLLVKYARSTSKKSEFTGLAEEYVQQLEKIKKEFPTKTVMINYFRVKSLLYQVKREFNATINTCTEAEKYYQENPAFSTKNRLAELALVKMVAFLHLRDYENGKKNADQCLKLYTEGSVNWLVFMEYYFLLALHSQNFSNAIQIFQRVISHPRLLNGPQFRLEKWQINEGYLNYVFESSWEKAESEEVEMFRKRFNVHKFLNEVPTFSKDKRGMNVSILILQVLFLLQRDKLDEIASRTDALRVYSSRYLRKDENYRSELFIRMLLTMESKSFDYSKTFAATQGYYSRLIATAKGKHGSLDGTEVIPFELLWERILHKLRSSNYDD